MTSHFDLQSLLLFFSSHSFTFVIVSDEMCVRRRVAVIGAGAAGLCAGRHVQRYSHLFELTIFEQTAQIGGTWCYDDTPNVHSSMYRDMKLV